MNNPTSRRGFLRTSGLATAPFLLPSGLFGREAPSEQITLGFIGMGLQGVGSKGWVQCQGWNGKWLTSDPKVMRIVEFSEQANYWPRPPIEHRDFLDAIKTRSKPAYHVEAGHRLATTLHLGHLACRSGRTIKWDPDRETFAGKDEANLKSLIYQRESRDWTKA